MTEVKIIVIVQTILIISVVKSLLFLDSTSIKINPSWSPGTETDEDVVECT